MKNRIVLMALCLVLAWAVSAFAQDKKRIMVVQHQDFAAYTVGLEGFMDGLENAGWKDKVEIIEIYNAHSDLAALDAKVDEIAGRDDIDLIYALGTHSFKRLKAKITDVPIVFTAVPDPMASGVIDDWKTSGANFTGVETPDYIALGIQLLHQLVEFKSLGMVYLEGSPSHDAAIAQVTALSQELGFEFKSSGFPLRTPEKVNYPDEVIRENLTKALEEVAPNVDVVFVQTSNTFTKNFDIFRDIFFKYETISSGDPLFIRQGIIMGIGRDIRRFGEQCAEYAVQILEGANPADLPMDVGTKLTIEVNIAVAEQVGYDPPLELLGSADEILQEVDY